MGMSTPPSSFGRREPAPEPPALPVLHLGQVQAELVVTISDEVLHALGTRIATEVANATAHGFAAGWQAATGQPFTPAEPAARPADVGPGVDLDKL